MTRYLLVIEDNPEDLEFLRRAFKKLKMTRPVRHYGDSQSAWEDLQRTAASVDQGECPALILLDLNMPGMDGRTLLQRIKSDSDLRHIPIVILSTSGSQSDIDFCYDHGANSYIVKQMDTEQQMTALQRLLDYWFAVVLLPHEETGPPCP